jgi:hypothetical protein
VRRLEEGVSITEAARSVLHRWRREFREEPGNAWQRQAALVKKELKAGRVSAGAKIPIVPIENSPPLD